MIVYAIDSIRSGKRYIGITSTSVKRRWSAHVAHAHKTPEQRAARGQAISEARRRFYANMTDDARAKHNERLAVARKNIDHSVRKDRQRKAVQTYWTSERRAQKSQDAKKNWRNQYRGSADA